MEVIPEVEESIILPVFKSAHFSKNLYFDLWKNFHGVENWLWKYYQGVEDWFLTTWMRRLSLEVIKMVEKRLIGLIEALSWLKLCFKKSFLDLSKYSHGVENRLWEYSQGVEEWFLTTWMRRTIHDGLVLKILWS